MNIYVYKMVADNGGAPCVWRGLLSLALCKPKIRKTASEGAIVFGFGGQAYGEKLIYAAKITAKPERGEYYVDPAFKWRPDRIYRLVNGVARRKARARFHHQTDQRERDVGMHFEKAFVLLSDDFRYFGKAGTDDYKRRFPLIRRLVEGLKRGHRVNYNKILHSEFLKLKANLWKKFRSRKLGPPTDAIRSGICNKENPSCTLHPN